MICIVVANVTPEQRLEAIPGAAVEFDLTTRLAILGCVFVSLAALETAWPQRELLLTRGARWKGNLGVFLFDVVVIGIPINGLVFGILVWAQSNAFGLMNWLAIPYAAKLVIGFLALDALFYAQHRVSHVVPVLWRLHRVHHADTEMDVTTANRVHPLESLWLTFLRVSLAVAIGVPIAAFIAFLVVLNVLSLFNHTNVKLPAGLDRILRTVIVTPNMHETHHSVHQADYDTNFAFVFSFWDRIFKTYKSETTPLDGRVTLGLDEFRSVRETSLFRLLTMPFRNAEEASARSRETA